jgi:hypothetical protein
VYPYVGYIHQDYHVQQPMLSYFRMLDDVVDIVQNKSQMMMMMFHLVIVVDYNCWSMLNENELLLDYQQQN